MMAESSGESFFMIEEFADRPLPYQHARYLMELSERIFRIAPIHGVDQADYEALREVAFSLSEEAGRDFINEEEC